MIRLVYAEITPLLEEGLYERTLAGVLPYRQEKVKRFKKQIDRCRSLAAGILLKKEIINKGLPYQEMEVKAGIWGKPQLVRRTEAGMGGDPLQFDRQTEAGWNEESLDFHYSLSHSGNYAAIAVSDRPVGIDIENADRIKNPASLAKRILTAEEHRQWERSCSGAGLARIWTRKEAWVKADGTGLSTDFRTIDTLGTWAESHICTMEAEPGLWLSACSFKEALQRIEMKKISIKEVTVQHTEQLRAFGQ